MAAPRRPHAGTISLAHLIDPGTLPDLDRSRSKNEAGVAGRILILRWTGSAYDSLGGLLEQTAQELAAMGHRVLLFTAGGQDWPHRLAALLQQGDIAFALSMSGIGIDLVLQGKGLLWEATKVPMFNWSCDHPCYYPARHGIRNRFMLRGGMFASAPLPLAERNGRIIFSKSGTDTNAIEANWRERVPVIRQILFDAAEELFHRSTGDFVPVLDRVGERRGLLLDGNN